MEKALRPMTRLEKMLDAKKPDGVVARLDKLTKDREELVKGASLRGRLIEDEIKNVAAGGTPGEILPLPKKAHQTQEQAAQAAPAS